MAPFSLVTASVSWLAKSFSALPSTSTLARYTSVLPASYINPVRCLTSQASGAPKRPMNAYLRYAVQQRPVIFRYNPELKGVDVTRQIAQQWRTMDPKQKQPFQEAFVQAREQYKVDHQRYKAQLSPAQVQQQVLERKQRLAKRKAIRKKRENTTMGKPKRPRTPWNIFMSEHFEEAKGTTAPVKLKSLHEDWKKLSSHQKQVYTQLAQDDKIRYKNEITAWENHMIEIGREDLIRERTLSSKIKTTAKKLPTGAKTAKAKVAKKPSGLGKKKTTRTIIKRSAVKTVSKS
ncbi:transcription factor A, mitochondrial-like [Clinocottus analis]|uniref:transcription factor A, mitochondrial-like n=1 Tax=Clinocottus analis TaxID=304258 RepID=UPI0035C0018C